MAIQSTDHLFETASRLKRQLTTEKHDFDVIRDYVKGTVGLAKVPSNSTEEIKELRKRSGKNVMPSVVNAYTDVLSVIGFVDPESETNAPVWQMFNELDLPALQGAVHRSVVQYGVGYLSALPGPHGLQARTGSPRDTITWYDTVGSLFPTYALELWTDSFGITRGVLVDEYNAYPLQYETEFTDRAVMTADPVPHGATIDGRPVTPVMRFLGQLSADQDDQIIGDVEPLIDLQRAINEVNFTRLLVTRYGAHPMKIITGWDAPDEEAYNAVANSVDKVLALGDENVGIHTFDPADPAAYTAVLSEMLSSVNTMAGLNPVTTGASTMTNLSAEAIALTDAIYRNRVDSKQRALAGSWKAYLRAVGSMVGVEVDPGSEVQWKSLENPTMGSVGNLISQAYPAGVPVAPLIDLIPGLTPQTRRNMKRKMEENESFDPESILMNAVNEITASRSGELE